MSETTSWFREIDHTGDIGIEVEAENVETLYARAAWGLFNLLTDVTAITPTEQQEIGVEADDHEALMVRWLSELNFLHITEGWLFNTFEVDMRPGPELHAAVRGEPIVPGRHHVYTEIKAVTFHDMHVRQREGGWQARIIFDM